MARIWRSSNTQPRESCQGGHPAAEDTTANTEQWRARNSRQSAKREPRSISQCDTTPYQCRKRSAGREFRFFVEIGIETTSSFPAMTDAEWSVQASHLLVGVLELSMLGSRTLIATLVSAPDCPSWRQLDEWRVPVIFVCCDASVSGPLCRKFETQCLRSIVNICAMGSGCATLTVPPD